MFEVETLQLIWWVLIVVLFTGFALTDGFDIGVGILLPIAGKTNTERRILINAIAPHWDGNQVWFVLGIGALFAAWPPVYATVFSLLYVPLMLCLFGLFFRPVGFDYRAKIDNATWRTFWDWGIFTGSALPIFLLGLSVGNLFLGIPFDIDEFHRPVVTSSFLGLFNPFAVFVGLLTLALMILHGATYAQVRTEGELFHRLTRFARYSSLTAIILFVIAGAALALYIKGYFIDSDRLVKTEIGAWLSGYTNRGIAIGLPLISIIGLVLAYLKAGESAVLAFSGSTIAMAGVLTTAATSLFPFIAPSSISMDDSLTVFNATSSHYTLTILTVMAMLFVPIILGYTFWCYRAMWGRITEKYIKDNGHSLY